MTQQRPNQYDAGNLRGLISDYERDIVNAQSIHKDDTWLQGDKDEAKIRKAADLLELFQRSKACKHLQSNVLGDHDEESVVVQMKRTHPARKKPILPLSDEELQAACKGISSNVLRDNVKGLKCDTTAGLGCLRNEHLLSLLLNSDHQMTPSAAVALDNLLDYANVLV